MKRLRTTLSIVACVACALLPSVAATCVISPIQGPQPRGPGLTYAGAAGTSAGDFFCLFGEVVEFYDTSQESTTYVLGGRAPPSGGNTYTFGGQHSAVHQRATESLFVADATGLIKIDVSQPATASGVLLVSTLDFSPSTKLAANDSHVFVSGAGCVYVVDPAAATPALERFAGVCGQAASTPIAGAVPGTSAMQPVLALEVAQKEVFVFTPGQVISVSVETAVMSPVGNLPAAVTSVPAAFATGQGPATRVAFFGPTGCTVYFAAGGNTPSVTSGDVSPASSCTSTTTLNAIAGSASSFSGIGTTSGSVSGFTFTCSADGGATGSPVTPPPPTTTTPVGLPTLPPGAPTGPQVPPITTAAPTDASSIDGNTPSDEDSSSTTIIVASIAAGTIVIIAVVVCLVVLFVVRGKKDTADAAQTGGDSKPTQDREPFGEQSMSTVPSTAASPLTSIQPNGKLPMDSLGRVRSTQSTMERSRGRNTPGTANASINMRSFGSAASSKAELRQSTASGIVVSALSRSDFSRPVDRVIGQRSWTDAELRRHNKRCQFVRDGAYQKGKLIGRGANGSVYGALLKDGSTIAMKEVNLMGSEDEIQEQMAEVEREMALLSMLHHDNLVTYYGVLCDRNRLAVSLFMENVTGGSLGGMARSMETPLAEVTGQIFTKQMLRGLAVLHEEGIVHRDLKCDNVLRDAHTGTVKLADFGTAKSVGNAVGASKAAQTMIGTPFFMAPEILAAGMGGSVDGGDEEEEGGYGVKADIWSLGITVGELLNRGNPPWPAFPSPGHAFLHIANPESEPLLPEGLSEMAVDFIRQCTRRNPRERPTARELLEHPWITLSCASGAFADDEAVSGCDDADARDQEPDAKAAEPLHNDFSDADDASSVELREEPSNFAIGAPEATLRDVDVAFDNHAV